MNLKRYVPTIAGLFIAFIVPFTFSLFTGQISGHLTDMSLVILSMVRAWSSAIALFIIILFWEGQPLSSIGMRKMTWQDLGWALAGFILGIMVFGLTTPLIKALNLGSTGGGITRLAELPLSLRVAAVLTAGITEEVLFRGYPIERLNTLTGSLGLSAALAYAVFVLLHIPFWGPGAGIQIGVWSLLVTGLYVWRRNLPACMLMHILNDAFAFLLLPVLLSGRLS